MKKLYTKNDLLEEYTVGYGDGAKRERELHEIQNELNDAIENARQTNKDIKWKFSKTEIEEPFNKSEENKLFIILVIFGLACIGAMWIIKG